MCVGVCQCIVGSVYLVRLYDCSVKLFTDFYKDSWLTVSFESEKRAGMLLFSSKSLPNSLVLGR